MADNELSDILQIMMTDGVGPVTFYKHLQTYNNSLTKTISAIAQKKNL